MVFKLFKRRFYQPQSVDMGDIKLPYELYADYKPNVIKREV